MGNEVSYCQSGCSFPRRCLEHVQVLMTGRTGGSFECEMDNHRRRKKIHRCYGEQQVINRLPQQLYNFVLSFFLSDAA
jgi:hypothetical protein